MITAAVSFKASLKPKRFFFLALFLLIAFLLSDFFRLHRGVAKISCKILFCQAVFEKNNFSVRLCGRFFDFTKSLKNKNICFYIYLYIDAIHTGEIISEKRARAAHIERVTRAVKYKTKNLQGTTWRGGV